MLTTPLETLKQMIDQPSGSLDQEDVTRVAEMFARELADLGFAVEKLTHPTLGPTLRCTIGEGERQLMLMGHMDTVFPHEVSVPFTPLGDGRAKGSGLTDMKGGLVVMLYALRKALPALDLKRYRLCVVLNPDEEIGSPSSADLLLETAKASFAALSFEPSGDGTLTCARKGVTSAFIACKGIPGHAGSQYKECASAIQALCAQITKLYALRDDAREISFNAGLIRGGTAENVVAPDASCKCEFRYFDQSLQKPLMERIQAICAEEPVPGVTTTVTFGASHPAIDLNEKSQALLDIALEIAARQGRQLRHVRTGGAGDIAIVGQAGIGVLDGLGLEGGGVHTVEEWGRLDKVDQEIDLAAELICRVCK